VGDRWLGEIQVLSGLGEIAGLRQGDEGFEVSQFQHAENPP
jgi:hypothetical protein